MVLHDVAVTQDNVRMVCVGTLTASADGLHPSKCRAEKQIIGESYMRHRRGYDAHVLMPTVYNMLEEKIEKCVTSPAVDRFVD